MILDLLVESGEDGEVMDVEDNGIRENKGNRRGE